jgi:3-hydroxybutyryl-CoA dehydrogenase
MKTGVIGAGVMGAGIAQVVALAGYEVVLFDLNSEAIQRGLKHITSNLDKGIAIGKVTPEQKDSCLANISTVHKISEVQVELVIEAVVERLDVKTDIFNKLAEINGDECILATNTSSIPITQISAKIPHPERVIGIHFFNPAHLMKLVEVVSGIQTASSIAERCIQFVNSLGKTAIHAKDAPGFIVNRVARHYYVESLKILEEGIADHETIDSLLQSSGFKMGPFRLMDLIGVETNFSVTESMYNLFYQDEKFRPSRIQKQKVDAGHFGRKTGQGFYNYNS